MGMTPGAPAAADMAVAVPIARDEAPGPSLHLTTLVELFTRDQSPGQALCTLLAMCWFWPSGCEAEEKDLFLGSVLLSLGRLLRAKLGCLAQDAAVCLSCRRGGKGDKQQVGGQQACFTGF